MVTGDLAYSEDFEGPLDPNVSLSNTAPATPFGEWARLYQHITDNDKCGEDPTCAWLWTDPDRPAFGPDMAFGPGRAIVRNWLDDILVSPWVSLAPAPGAVGTVLSFRRFRGSEFAGGIVQNWSVRARIRVDNTDTSIPGVLVLGLALAGGLPAVAADNPGDTGGKYGDSLSRVYFAHQRLLAVRDACDQAFPAQAKANAKAYAAWQARHKVLLAELDTRVTPMIRGASRDEREYMRNVGEYEGYILEYRNSERDELLAQPREGMEQGCTDFRNYLTASGSDYQKEYAEELRVLRQRKLPK